MRRSLLLLSFICVIAAAISCGDNIMPTPEPEPTPTPTPTPDPDPDKPLLDDNTIVFLNLSAYASLNSENQSQVMKLWDVMHLSATLQGIVNRDKPVLYSRYVNLDSIEPDKIWWDRYIGTGEWLGNMKVKRVSDPVEAAELFKDRVKGMVVYDSDFAPASNLASTVAGADDLIAVRYDPSSSSIYSRLVEKGWKTVVDLRAKDGKAMFASKAEAYQWAVDNYLKTGKCSAEYAGYYVDQFWRKCPSNADPSNHALPNHDFFVSKKAFFFDLSPWDDEAATDAPGEPVGADFEMLKTILAELYRINGADKFCHIGGFPAWPYKYSNNGTVGGKHGAVETEWQFVKIVSEYNAFIDADAPAFGCMANASFWQYFPIKDQYLQKKNWPTTEELKAKGYLTADGKVDLTKKYIMFYSGDYDSSAWLYQRINWLWKDSARGKLPLNWAVSPILERRAPMAMAYMRDNATENDYFMAADNGAGYLCPGALDQREISGLPSALDAWKRHSAPLYKKWDLSISGFIIDGLARRMSEEAFLAYSEFSPNGVCPMWVSQTAHLVNGMPVLRAGSSVDAEKPAEAAAFVVSKLAAPAELPFYWFRSVLRTPIWHLEVKEGIEKADASACWLSAPEFFELLRCYLKENHGTTN